MSGPWWKGIPWVCIPPVYSSVPPVALVSALAAHVRTGVGEHATHALRNHLGNGAVVFTNGGTAALAMAFKVAETRTGSSHVALPAYCCPDVAAAAVFAGHRIHLYDVDPNTLQPDWESLRLAFREGARVAVVVHLFGRPVDWHQAEAIAGEFDVLLIEDAAQGAGARWRGRPVGSLGALSVMSFGRGKGINTGGGGVLIVNEGVTTSDAQDTLQPFPRGASCRHLVRTALTQVLAHPAFFAVPASIPQLGLGETRYHNLDALQQASLSTLALLPWALSRLAADTERRRGVERWYRQQLESRPELLVAPSAEPNADGALRLPVRLDPDVGATLRRFGVARSYPRTLADYGEVTSALIGTPDLPGSRELAAQLHTLPTHELAPLSLRKRLVARLLEK